MISPAKTKLFNRWLLEWKLYNKETWGHFSVLKLFHLSYTFPEEVNIVPNLFIRPNWLEVHYFFDEYYDWRPSFNIHLTRLFFQTQYLEKNMGNKQPFLNINDICCLPNSIGEILRFTFFGDSNYCQAL